MRALCHFGSVEIRESLGQWEARMLAEPEPVEEIAQRLPKANAAKLLSAEAGFEACDAALQTHGGYCYAKEFHVERLWREVRLYKIARVSQQMALN